MDEHRRWGGTGAYEQEHMQQWMSIDVGGDGGIQKGTYYVG